MVWLGRLRTPSVGIALWCDEEYFADEFATYFVPGILAIAALFVAVTTLNWIALGFPENRRRLFYRRARVLFFVLIAASFGYLAVAMFRYDVVGIVSVDRADRVPRYLVLDRLTGEIRSEFACKRGLSVPRYEGSAAGF